MFKYFLLFILGVVLQAYSSFCLAQYVEWRKRRCEKKTDCYAIQGMTATLMFMLVLSLIPTFLADRVGIFGVFYIALFLLHIAMFYGEMTLGVLIVTLGNLLAGILLISISLTYQ
jgi:hypothetical protein